MNNLKVVSTDDAPKAVGPYSQAVVYNDCVFLSGQIGLCPETMEFAGEDFSSQAHQIWKNISNVLTNSGSSMNEIIKINVFITDMDNFPVLNEHMKEVFNDPYPARSTVEVSGLPLGALLEIDVVAGITK